MNEGPSTGSPDHPHERGGIWRGLRTLLFGEEQEESLRERLEEAIEEHESDGGTPPAGDLAPIERQMLKNLLHFGERDAGDVGVPRADIVAVEEQTSFANLVQLFAEAGHSRLPVYREELDTIIGMVHIKDVFGILAKGEAYPPSIAELIRQPLYVPQSMGALDLLAQMRVKRTHLAVVLDEYSGTEGLITIEDLIEEIVGEIEDEHDEAPAALIVPIDGGGWEADARAELEDVAETVDPRPRLRARGPCAASRRVPGACQRLEARGHRRRRAQGEPTAAASARSADGGRGVTSSHVIPAEAGIHWGIRFGACCYREATGSRLSPG
jgi:CBS-domain-containing membrane protein